FRSHTISARSGVTPIQPLPATMHSVECMATTLAGRSRRYLFGRPLRRQDLPHQVLPRRYALPVFASDNLSSVAYATEEILIVLALAGTAYYSRSLWIAAVIMLGYGVILISYRQTMSAYP